MKRLTFLFFFSQFFILGLFAEDIIVRTAQDLMDIQQKVSEGTDFSGSTIRLANDITLEDIDWTPIGSEDRPFRGSFDGGGHWIHNLTVNVVRGIYAGFFGYIGTGGKVQRLGISSGVVRVREKANPDYGCYVGGIAAYSEGTISQCANLATIYGNQTYADVGGIVGEMFTGAVLEDCYNLGRLYTSKGDESDDNYLGGIVGLCDGPIKRVYVEASIEGNTEVNSGGIVAFEDWYCDVQNAYYQGNLVNDTYYYYENRSMRGFHLDGLLNERGDYTIWSFADGRLPLLTCMLELLKGDVNMDGQVSIADVTALVNIILGKDNVPPYQYDHVAANVNEDDTVSIADVTALVNIILGKEEVTLP